MRKRFEEFSLSLNPDKTRLIEFGRFAAERRVHRADSEPDAWRVARRPDTQPDAHADTDAHAESDSRADAEPDAVAEPGSESDAVTQPGQRHPVDEPRQHERLGKHPAEERWMPRMRGWHCCVLAAGDFR